ncbi:MAG: MopE-related protein [Bacteroidota bacterium]
MKGKLTIIGAILLFLIPTVTVQAQHSVAREWNEALLEAIRNDFARPTVHARNLFHTSVAMYDAWAVYDEEAETFFLGKDVGGYECPFTTVAAPDDIEEAREEAISYAAYRLLVHRFQNSPGAFLTINRLNVLFNNLGYDASFTSVDYETGPPAALGNYIAQELIAFGRQDGSNEEFDYANQYYEPVNEPLIVELPGNPDITDFNRWQPLTLELFIDQGGNPIPGATPPFLSPEWGNVVPFALEAEDLNIYERDGDQYYVYHDPGPPAYLDMDGGGTSDEYQYTFALVSVWSSHLSPDDGVMWDISPASIGNIAVEDYPTTIEGLRDFYNLVDGGDIGEGWDINPVTGLPYEPQMVPRGDYARILAEFWADGPDSETPPGHWFTILNYVNEHPLLERRFGGQGEELDELEWDVKCYMALGGAMHDAAVTVWGIKGWYDYLRPISALRGMAELGQSSDADLPNYHPAGIPLLDGFIELVDADDPLAGNDGENIGKIKLHAWRGPDYIDIPEIQEAGVDWILADNWWPYQRPTFVSPNFAGYVSGHSTYSRAAAEMLTALTGDPYFPGGVGEFFAPEDEFLVFEDGPSMDITLQWATYRDASDQCSLSRIWGGIHPPVDDVPGRLMGIELGLDAFELARSLFYKDEDGDGFYSYEDCDDTRNDVYPGAPEICDGVDNNCDGDTDEGVLLTFYADTDEDGFGDAASFELACAAPDGFVADNTDCDDNDGDEFPGQVWYLDRDGDNFGDGSTEVSCERPMNGFLADELTATDTDCDDNDGDEFPGQVWYLDRDGDNFGDGSTEVSCERPTNGFLADELTTIDTDCNDNNANEFPGQEWYLDVDTDGFGSVSGVVVACERPADGFLSSELTAPDTDCDDADANEFPGQSWYTDADADGYGNGEVTISCERPAATAYFAGELQQTSGDCDDTKNVVYPGAPELCDDLDNDCNDEIDEDLPLFTYYRDTDGDGFGDATDAIEICGDLPEGYSANNEDCDDINASIYPQANEIADNGVDEDCSGVDLFETTKIFPNPTSDVLTIHLKRNGRLNVEIYDLSGRLLYGSQERLEDNRIFVDMSSLRSGLYLLRLETLDRKEVLVEKVTKM